MNKRHFASWCMLLAALLFTAQEARATPVIRDAEVEHTLRLLADPIFKANGLKPSAVKIFVVNSDQLNAYVAGGANMFIYTGMILACQRADMLMGVMAHETGHIAGGHLARGAEQLKNAQLGTILSYVLGAAAAAAGSPDAATAVITGGQTSLMRNFFAYTRSNEEAADQSAVNALDKLNISSEGMIKMFELLRRHEREHMGKPDPYMLTHPLTGLRIDHVRHHVQESSIPDGQYPKSLDMPYDRMVAKLYGFIESPERTFAKYPKSNTSIPARMARAVAYYKMPDLTQSMVEMDSLIAELPNDPFMHELKGQILFENNKPKEALAAYRKAVELLPDAPLILTELGKVELAQQDPALVPSAITHLETARRLDDSNSMTWRLLATAYGKKGDEGMMTLALAEESLLINEPKRSIAYAEKALTLLPQNSPSYRRAQDVKLFALDEQKHADDAKSPF